MHRTYLADIERGARNVTLRSIAQLAQALELTVGALFAFSQPAGTGKAASKGRKVPAPREILLVEDSATDAELTRRAFRRAKIANHLTVMRDAEEALQYLFGRRRGGQRALPQLILLDLRLPGMSGQEFLRLIKADRRTRDIPVVVLSASADRSDIVECSRIGAEHYIIKPVGFEGLSRVTPHLDLQWALLDPVR